MLQILIAIFAGILTAGAPCILPLLPILLATSVGRSSKTRPLFIVLGFIITFSLVGLSLSYLVTHTGLHTDTLRSIAIIMLVVFAVFMIWPTPFEKLTMYLNGYINKANAIGSKAGTGNKGGFVLGVMMALIWTPCAGPVLGSVLTLIAASENLGKAAVLLITYAIGAGIPMLAIAYGSQYVTTKVRAIAPYTARIQQVFGVLVLLLAITMFFGYDLVLQAKLVEYYPGIVPKY